MELRGVCVGVDMPAHYLTALLEHVIYVGSGKITINGPNGVPNLHCAVATRTVPRPRGVQEQFA